MFYCIDLWQSLYICGILFDMSGLGCLWASWLSRTLFVVHRLGVYREARCMAMVEMQPTLALKMVL